MNAHMRGAFAILVPTRKTNGPSGDGPLCVDAEIRLLDQLEKKRGRGSSHRHQRGADRDRSARRDHEFAPIPGRDERRNAVRQRFHDSGFERGRHADTAAAFGFAVHRLPEFDIRRRLTPTNGGFGKLAIQPGVDRRRQDARRGAEVLLKRDLAIGQGRRYGRLLGAARPLGCRAEATIRMKINHYAYFSSLRAWSASRARWTRIFNAPTVVPSRSAISSYDRPSTCFITNASRSEAGNTASALSRSIRSSVRSRSSSGVA